MDALQLAKMVKNMRDAQRKYFGNRSDYNLAMAKKLEKDLDRTLDEILSGATTLNFGD